MTHPTLPPPPPQGPPIQEGDETWFMQIVFVAGAIVLALVSML